MNKSVIQIFLAIIFFVCKGEVSATIFKKMPLDDLVGEANSAAEVALQSRKSYINKDRHIMTEYTFKILESYNLNQKFVENGNLLKLNLPGGIVGRLSSKVESAPVFHNNSPVFILLKEVESKIYLSNYSLGKFDIVTIKGKKIYKSSVFPADKELGIVPQDKMLSLITKKFRPNAEVVVKNTVSENRAPESEFRKRRLFQRDSEKLRRAPALDDDYMNNPASMHSNRNGLFALWGFVALFSFCAFYIWRKLKYWNSNGSKN